MKQVFLSLSMLGLVAVAPAAAQGTPEQRAACQDDAYKFCPWDVPDVEAVEKCLKTYINQISPACRAQFGVSPRGRRS